MSRLQTGRRQHSYPPRIWVAALGLFVFYLVVALALRYPVNEAKIPVTGDEHHYLTQAHSLVTDGDLVVLDDYEDGDYLSFYGNALDPSLWNLMGSSGYSGHPPGVGIAIVPGWWAAGWVGVLVTLAMATGGTFVMAAAVLTRTVRGRLSTPALLLLISGFVALPIFPYSHTLYPETLMAPLVTAVVLLAVIHSQTSVSWRKTSAALAAISLCGLSIGLHPKFSTVLVGVTLYFVGVSTYEAFRAGRVAPLAPAVGYVGAAGGWLALFSWFHFLMWDTFHPGGWFVQVSSTRAVGLGRGVVQFLDLLLGSQNGLFLMVPVALLALAFLLKAARPSSDSLMRRLGLIVVILVISIAGLAAFSVDWHGGDSPLGRYATPTVAVLLLTGGYLVTEQRLSRGRTLLLMAFGLVALLQTLAYVSSPMSFRPRVDGAVPAVSVITDWLRVESPDLSWVWSATTSVAWPGIVLWIVTGGLTLWLFGRDQRTRLLTTEHEYEPSSEDPGVVEPPVVDVQPT